MRAKSLGRLDQTKTKGDTAEVVEKAIKVTSTTEAIALQTAI